MMSLLVPILCGVAALALVVAIGVFWGLSRRAALTDGPATLAAALSAHALPGTANPVFYQGERAGRPWLLAGVTLTNQKGFTSTNVRESTRLVVQVHARFSDEVIVLRRHDRAQDGLGSFGEAFEQRKNDAALSAAQQAAMLSFVQQFEGGLRLRPRAGADTRLIPAGAWGSTGYILVHDRMRIDLGAAEVEAALAGLDTVARRLEGGE